MDFYTIIGLLVIFGVVSIILNNLKPKQTNGAFEYQVKGKLFTPAERSFLGVLEQAIEDKYYIFGKVRIADILTPKKGYSRSNWQRAFNSIAKKHFDFVLCNKDDLSVATVIELNDKSHQNTKTSRRDNLVGQYCVSAGLKLIKIKAKRSYDLNEIKNQLRDNENEQIGSEIKGQEDNLPGNISTG